MKKTDYYMLAIMLLTFILAIAILPDYPKTSIKLFLIFLIEGILWTFLHLVSRNS